MEEIDPTEWSSWGRGRLGGDEKTGPLRPGDVVGTTTEGKTWVGMVTDACRDGPAWIAWACGGRVAVDARTWRKTSHDAGPPPTVRLMSGDALAETIETE